MKSHRDPRGEPKRLPSLRSGILYCPTRARSSKGATMHSTRSRSFWQVLLSVWLVPVYLLTTVPCGSAAVEAQSKPPASLKPLHEWLIRQQEETTGLLPSQQDDVASLYANVIAAMALLLNGDTARAKRIFDFFNSRMNETEFYVNGASRGFFQYRNSATGEPNPGSNRWMGDNAWLLLGLHYYQKVTGSNEYSQMALEILDLLSGFQQPGGFIASGWANGDTHFDYGGAAEGNLDAYKALMLYGRTAEASRIKDWLDHSDLGWKATYLDIHSWRVLSLGPEYGYCLQDLSPFECKIRYNKKMVQGFLPFTKEVSPIDCNIWTEGTSHNVMAFFKAGYPDKGAFYLKQLKSLLFEPPDFPGTQAISYFALPEPQEHPWADPTKGHVAAVGWYIFASRHFDPFEGEILSITKPVNPLVKIEAEGFTSKSASGVRNDSRGVLSEGNAIHVGGDNEVPEDENGWVTYEFNVPTAIRSGSLLLIYADDQGGDICRIFLDGVRVSEFDTEDTGGWDLFVTKEMNLKRIPAGHHTLKLEVLDKGRYGVTFDYFSLQKT
jgi:hypothetical protein